jgi:hypothetical protein
MIEGIKIIAFVLVIAGTAGLLVNEFVFDWGKYAAILFAVLNVVALIILGMTLSIRKGN